MHPSYYLSRGRSYFVWSGQACLLILLVISLAACEERPEGRSDDADSARVDTPAMPVPPVDPGVGTNAGPTGAGGEPGVTVSEIVNASSDRMSEAGTLRILDRINEPLRTETETRENRHEPGQIDTVRTHHYDGLALTVYEVAGGKELLAMLRVTDGSYETEEGLRVGSSQDEVENRLGAPDRREDDAYVYELGEGMPTLLFVHFHDREVDELVWNFPID